MDVSSDKLYDKISSIKSCLEKSKEKLQGIGLSNGILGLSLFYYYCFLDSKDEYSLNLSLEIVEECIEKLDGDYTSFTTKTDIIQLGLYLQFLTHHNVLKEDEFMLEFDQIVLEITRLEINNKNLDNISGALTGGTYFLSRSTDSDQTEILLEIFNLIEQESIRLNEDMIYWEFDLRGEKNIELNLHHGSAGIVSFLLKLYTITALHKDKCKEMIYSAINFILSQKKYGQINMFPQNAFTEDMLGYHNFTYGDIGIGYIITETGKKFEDDFLISEGLEILKNAALYRDPHKEFIKDANIIYGASGLNLLFAHFHEIYGMDVFKQAEVHWYHEILKLGNENSQWAGYNTYFNGTYDFAQLSLSQGLAGIGINLLNNKKSTPSFLRLLGYDI
ncbi:hypothetical protein C1637_05365 [Chryseobacterium lactis]|uniref:Lanthionine synthetase n=1 Tax=Chryseobacterium lactis TaxID=1241981 RepID=A0A3G6RHY8_CHRLC|nr:lanthionine synthetase LanC family protein [Chryseobacterium lactis]AZA84274.1 hypothetical protein EG342_21335 [Chryseobacterium lactis]AZB04662.1 hypothetical protein EG341_12215 [Chryseobacterium lactis]PNW14393.1 hypothetical protein C1637_05365 [Chryseobacterium lactis]